jgi:UDP-glucose 4-epimerase
MKVLVTGGAGYIGSATVTELLRHRHQVVVFDNLSQGHRAAVPPEATFIQGDLADHAALAALFRAHPHIDAILHFASNTLVGESMQYPLKYLGDNYTNALNLLEHAVEHGVKRFILSSTANLFSTPQRIPIDEQEAIIPGSPYGESKYFIERLLHWFSEIHGLNYACLRYFNAAGGMADQGEDHDPETHLIPIILQVALGQREQVTVFGDDYQTHDGTCIRDYIHVSDLARAHILAMEALDQFGNRVYNLGNGTGFSILDVIEAARRITGHAIPYTVGPRRAGDPPILIASPEAIRQELGWQPKYSTIDDIVGSAWEWHRTHPHGYADG